MTSTNANPFFAIKKRHPEAVKVRLSRVAFTGSTLRMFREGSADSIRTFVRERIGFAPWLSNLEEKGRFDAHFYELIDTFPRGLRIGKKRKLPTFGHKAKIVCLYFKTLLTERVPLNSRTAAKVGQWFHVPLDNIVLRHIYEHFGDELGLERRPTLSGLRKAQYKRIQELLRTKAKKAGVLPIWYDDFWALRDQEKS